jgi:D-arabinose 1-dehydrogenase-like Zn-dependent alcohol dehydrogenase
MSTDRHVLPATMMCVEIRTPGGPEALVPTQRPVPQPKAGELLIKVAASGVNRPDLAQRAGSYPPPPGATPRRRALPTCRGSRRRARWRRWARA